MDAVSKEVTSFFCTVVKQRRRMHTLVGQIYKKRNEVGVALVVSVDHKQAFTDLPGLILKVAFFNALKRTRQPAISGETLLEGRDNVASGRVSVVELDVVKGLLAGG